MPINQIKRAVEGTTEAITRSISRYNFIDEMTRSIKKVQNAFIQSVTKEETLNDETLTTVAEGVLSSPSVKANNFAKNKDALLFLKDRADKSLGPIYEHRNSLTQKQTLQTEKQVNEHEQDANKGEKPGRQSPSPGKKFS